jgi:hypothetical protein
MPIDRSEKWKTKTTPDLLTPRLEALHELSSETITETYRSIDALYDRVAKILDQEGVTVTTRLMYRSYAEQLWKFSRKYTGKTFEVEADAVSLKYDVYGADIDILKRIGSLFGLRIGTYFIREIIHVVEASRITCGLDAAKSAFPSKGDVYFATDTKILYLCSATGIWTGVELAS